MSVIITIPPDVDWMINNASYRILVDSVRSRGWREDDLAVLEAADRAYGLNLTRLETDQARRVAWILRDAGILQREERVSEVSVRRMGELIELLEDAYGTPDSATVLPNGA
jgi:hypothetical protein